MLVLSRKVGEKIIIGNNICVTVVEIVGKKVRIGIDAPSEVSIDREEIRNSKNYNKQFRSQNAVATEKP